MSLTQGSRPVGLGHHVSAYTERFFQKRNLLQVEVYPASLLGQQGRHQHLDSFALHYLIGGGVLSLHVGVHGHLGTPGSADGHYQVEGYGTPLSYQMGPGFVADGYLHQLLLRFGGPQGAYSCVQSA